MTTDKLTYSVKCSNRKTLAIRFGIDGTVTVLAPISAKKRDIDLALERNRAWIEKRIAERKKLLEGKNVTPITPDEIERLKALANEVLPERLCRLASELGVAYNKLTVKNMLSRWGSCSVGKNISINCLLMLAPDVVIDYILIHELAHLKYMDHSKPFYALIDAYFPYRRDCERWLKTEGVLIINRARLGKK